MIALLYFLVYIKPSFKRVFRYSFYYSQSPKSSFCPASFSWPGPTFLRRPLSPSISSISRRAMDPLFLSMEPPLPMITPLVVSLDFMIVARYGLVRLLVSPHAVNNYRDWVWNFFTSQTESFHDHFLKPRNVPMVGNLVSGKYWKPSSRFSLRYNQTGNMLPAELGNWHDFFETICWRKSSICAKSWSDGLFITLLTTKIIRHLSRFVCSIIISSPLATRLISRYHEENRQLLRRGAISRFDHETTQSRLGLMDSWRVDKDNLFLSVVYINAL